VVGAGVVAGGRRRAGGPGGGGGSAAGGSPGAEGRLSCWRSRRTARWRTFGANVRSRCWVRPLAGRWCRSEWCSEGAIGAGVGRLARSVLVAYPLEVLGDGSRRQLLKRVAGRDAVSDDHGVGAGRALSGPGACFCGGSSGVRGFWAPRHRWCRCVRLTGREVAVPTVRPRDGGRSFSGGCSGYLGRRRSSPSPVTTLDAAGIGWDTTEYKGDEDRRRYSVTACSRGRTLGLGPPDAPATYRRAHLRQPRGPRHPPNYSVPSAEVDTSRCDHHPAGRSLGRCA
jgi:hypothetical protein